MISCIKLCYYLHFITLTEINLEVNPFHVVAIFLYPLKTSENHRFSDIFMEYNKETSGMKHCVKSVPIRSFSGPHFAVFGLNAERYGVQMWQNTDEKNSKYGHFLRSEMGLKSLKIVFTMLKTRKNLCTFYNWNYLLN